VASRESRIFRRFGEWQALTRACYFLAAERCDAVGFDCSMLQLGRQDRYCVNVRSARPMNCNEANRAALLVADWMSLAAAPIFIIMALLTGGIGGGSPDLLCSAGHGPLPLSGMAPMYWLMSAFHSTPWVKLINRRQRAARQSA
jgi:hypothetical protein